MRCHVNSGVMEVNCWRTTSRQPCLGRPGGRRQSAPSAGDDSRVDTRRRARMIKSIVRVVSLVALSSLSVGSTKGHLLVVRCTRPSPVLRGQPLPSGPAALAVSYLAVSYLGVNSRSSLSLRTNHRRPEKHRFRRSGHSMMHLPEAQMCTRSAKTKCCTHGQWPVHWHRAPRKGR